MENPDFLIKNKLEQIVENFKVSGNTFEICVGRKAAEGSPGRPLETSTISVKRRHTCMKSAAVSSDFSRQLLDNQRTPDLYTHFPEFAGFPRIVLK
jgi:hypothetical protein